MPNLLDVALSCLVVGAGASLAFQQVLNANLRLALGSPWWAGVASYGTGLITVLALAAVAPGPRLSLAAIARPPLAAWSGGLFGAIFVVSAILAVPRLGAATVLALVVLGQMAGALSFDQFGILGLPQQPASLARLAGAGFLILGVVLVRG